MRKKFRFLTVLAVCVMVLSCFSVTAFAYADDTEQNLPVTETAQPEQQPETTPAPEKPKGEPIDDEGNAYTRDLLYDKATNKQFITIQTKSGNTDVYKRQSPTHWKVKTVQAFGLPAGSVKAKRVGFAGRASVNRRRINIPHK